MKKIAKFEKISLKEFQNSNLSSKANYNDIILPKRASSGSAGYDFVAPYDIVLNPQESVVVLTGIRSKMDDGWVLFLLPRSSMGFKYHMQLANTVGVIDSDYYYSDNEGHIMIKISNNHPNNEVLIINKGQSFVQGVFLPYGLCVDDDCKKVRNGGIGSSD